MERNQRKTLVGRVVSDKMDKTITVVVETKRNHPVYGKRINYSKKYKAHDENNVAKEGDIVRIMETRPLSATKHFRLVEVVEEAVAGNGTHNCGIFNCQYIHYCTVFPFCRPIL